MWIFELAYRRKISVKHIRVMPDGTLYFLCPRCALHIEREYTEFCVGCGQRLGWSMLYNAVELNWPEKIPERKSAAGIIRLGIVNLTICFNKFFHRF